MNASRQYIIRKAKGSKRFWDKKRGRWGTREEATVFVLHAGEAVVARLRRSGWPEAMLLLAPRRDGGKLLLTLIELLREVQKRHLREPNSDAMEYCPGCQRSPHNVPSHTADCLVPRISAALRRADRVKPIPRKALDIVLALAVQGRIDHTGEGTSLEPEDKAAIKAVCAHFGLELPELY